MPRVAFPSAFGAWVDGVDDARLVRTQSGTDHDSLDAATSCTVGSVF